MTGESEKFELPEDLELWPTNPRELFQLPPGASKRDLKIAYTKQIRRFKPEHFPEHFRRLRESFDLLNQLLEWQHSIDESDLHSIDIKSSNTDPIVPVAPIKIEVPTESFDPLSILPVTHFEIADFNQGHRIWQQIVDGLDLAEAYKKLLELLELPTRTWADYARLYWILTLRPEIDRERDPGLWLLDGIRQHGLSNPLPLLVSMDVFRRKGQVDCILDPKLLDEISISSSIIDIMNARWFAAREHIQFDLICRDLDALKLHFFDETEVWVQLLVHAINNFVMLKNSMVEQFLPILEHEVQALEDQRAVSHLLEWCEQSVNLHHCWNRNLTELQLKPLKQIQLTDHLGLQQNVRTNRRFQQTKVTYEQLLELIGKTWRTPDFYLLEPLVEFCAQLPANPEDCYDELAAIDQLARPIIFRFYVLMRSSVSELIDFNNEEIGEATSGVIQNFVQDGIWTGKHWAHTVLNFCVAEAVQPELIAMALDQMASQTMADGFPLANQIRADLSLHCVCLVYQLLSSPMTAVT